MRTRTGDNLMVHKAIEMAAPGDVIAVEAGTWDRRWVDEALRSRGCDPG